MSEQSKPLSLRWNQLTLDAIKYTKTSPPLAARALAMVHTAMYDAWSVYNKTAISTTTAMYIKIPYESCTKDERRKAYSFAAYRVLTELFWLALPPKHKDMFRDLMCECGYDPDNTTLNITEHEGIGNLAARMTIEYRNGDGSNPHATLHIPAWGDYTGYRPVNTWDEVKDINFWQPLRTEVSPGKFKVQSFLTPHWGLVRSFSLDYNSIFRADPPFRKNQQEFKEQAGEILSISECLTDEQKVIAEYWADGPGTYTPPGHWCEIAQFIANTRHSYCNSDCIKLFFALTNALLDVSITCWESKYRFNSVRPVSAIRDLYKGKDIRAWGGPGQGTITMKGEKWLTYIPTPPFPEHSSGHSSFSRCAATILNCYTGSDDFGGCKTVEKGESLIEPGVTPCEDILLDWQTLDAAATQAGLSRLYGGIHFSRANEMGQKMGRSVAEQAWEKAKYYINDKNFQNKKSINYNNQLNTAAI